PDVQALRAILSASMNIRTGKSMDLWTRGKALQRKHGGIPHKSEYETAAGLWSVIRGAILALKEDTHP
ncbi:MAG TPA: hypothetical protein VKA19_06920, partial [Alphaproteobacteria bacterium]|nr:hypothetical protein [Alphaproteobacteria bacterium]